MVGRIENWPAEPLLWHLSVGSQYSVALKCLLHADPGSYQLQKLSLLSLGRSATPAVLLWGTTVQV